MKIKRYIVQDMREAVLLIKNDLGPDAMIISSKKLREKGLKGLLSPVKIEVTAAAELGNDAVMTLATYEQQNTQLQAPVNKLDAYKIRQCLLKMDVGPETIDFLLHDLDAMNNHNEIKPALQQRLRSVFKPVPHRQKSPDIMAFVGVPGVGKTTTIAKIAAINALFNNMRISLITIDSFRVGAVEQMRIYGEIIGASVDVVSTPGELQQAVDKNRDRDLILIDTTGRPSRNTYQLAEIKAFLEVIKGVNTYLVINATTKISDAVRIINDYKVIPYSQLIVSKLDETESPGMLLNAAYLTGLPIAYITNGQNVPDDIEIASPESLVSYIMKEVVY
jgi:flagellar biosynthesis protein FlhF